MNVVLWILQGILALLFLFSGSTKLLQPKSKLAEDPRMGWTNDFSQQTIKLIGAAEVLGALGLILPGITGIAEILTPLAASGLTVIMIGATVTHIRRGEKQVWPMTIVIGVLAAVVAILRFGPYPL